MLSEPKYIQEEESVGFCVQHKLFRTNKKRSDILFRQNFKIVNCKRILKENQET